MHVESGQQEEVQVSQEEIVDANGLDRERAKRVCRAAVP